MRFGRTEKRWIHTCEAPIFKIAAAAFPELLQGALGIDILKITPAVFEAYLKCPTKCWLRATNEPSVGGTYSEWVKAQNDSYRFSGTRRLLFAEFPNDEVVLSPDMKNFKDAKWRLASSLTVQTQIDCCALQSELHALERVPAHAGISRHNLRK